MSVATSLAAMMRMNQGSLLSPRSCRIYIERGYVRKKKQKSQLENKLSEFKWKHLYGAVFFLCVVTPSVYGFVQILMDREKRWYFRDQKPRQAKVVDWILGEEQQSVKSKPVVTSQKVRAFVQGSDK